jgi:hypothetical protein
VKEKDYGGRCGGGRGLWQRIVEEKYYGGGGMGELWKRTGGEEDLRGGGLWSGRIVEEDCRGRGLWRGILFFWPLAASKKKRVMYCVSGNFSDTNLAISPEKWIYSFSEN